MIQNPILKGFNPDPSIVRVGDDYYIATSTFEWFPGVQIHHSKDLRNWKLIARPLDRVSQLDMKGNPDSCGVWAPCLSYYDGLFYLVYSNVRSFDGVWKDTPNYLVTAKDINGPWSEPIYLSSRGFDGSMFHDDDGKKYFLNMLMDHRGGKFFGGIEIQEFNSKAQKLIGEPTYLTPGSPLGVTEGPHIFKKGTYYYLVLAEGGTEYNHAITIARSRHILGPYKYHPNNPLVSSRDNEQHGLQKAGHGDFVETPEGDWYTVFLVGRPLTPLGKCTLGRETAIEKVIWKEDWPYLKAGSAVPRMEIPIKTSEIRSLEKNTTFFDFNDEQLPIDFQSLRVPITEDWCSLQQRSGYLRLYGRESLASLHDQSLLARRIQAFHIEASVKVDFEPESFQHMAGLVFYYNTGHYHYLCVTSNYEGTRKFLSIYTCDNFNMTYQEELLDITGQRAVHLKGIMNRDKLQFLASHDGQDYENIGDELDASILSDDHVREGGDRYRPAFTGSFVGMCCQDLASKEKYADFDWFMYKEI